MYILYAAVHTYVMYYARITLFTFSFAYELVKAFWRKLAP